MDRKNGSRKCCRTRGNAALCVYMNNGKDRNDVCSVKVNNCGNNKGKNGTMGGVCNRPLGYNSNNDNTARVYLMSKILDGLGTTCRDGHLLVMTKNRNKTRGPGGDPNLFNKNARKNEPAGDTNAAFNTTARDGNFSFNLNRVNHSNAVGAPTNKRNGNNNNNNLCNNCTPVGRNDRAGYPNNNNDNCIGGGLLGIGTAAVTNGRSFLSPSNMSRAKRTNSNTTLVA